VMATRARSRSLSKGPSWLSSHKDEGATSKAGRPPGVALANDSCQVDSGLAGVDQRRLVLLEQLFLLRLQRSVGPATRRLGDGVSGELWQRVLGVVLEIEPPMCQLLLNLVSEKGMYLLPRPCFI
jgi:hypothetical protein